MTAKSMQTRGEIAANTRQICSNTCIKYPANTWQICRNTCTKYLVKLAAISSKHAANLQQYTKQISNKTCGNFPAKDAANMLQSTQQMFSNSCGKIPAKHVAT
jgi:hypothetical protein